MCFVFSIIPATFWAVIGFLVLLGASKTDGGLKTFGRVLGVWACILAALMPLGGLFVSVAGLCPIDAMVEQMPMPPVS